MNKILLSLLVLILVSISSLTNAQERSVPNDSREEVKANVKSDESVNPSDDTKKTQRAKTAADKILDQRIENLNKLKERVAQFKNVNDTDKTSINTVISNVISDLGLLRTAIENATSTDYVKQVREMVNNNYRVYALIMPQLSIIASADRMITTVSMLSIVASKIEVRLGAVATGTDITSANLALANKSLQAMKDKLVQSQADAQSAVNLVAPLVPDQGDKTVADSNLKTMKDARAKIKSAQTNIVGAKKDAETITKILAKEKRAQKTATTTQLENIKIDQKTDR
jgi:hypothetical protein